MGIVTLGNFSLTSSGDIRQGLALHAGKGAVWESLFEAALASTQLGVWLSDGEGVWGVE